MGCRLKTQALCLRFVFRGIEMLKFSVLVDDEVHLPGCLPERGLALLLECDGLRVLFDSGRGRALRHNAAVMGVDLGSLPHCSAEPVWLSERLVFLGSILRRDQARPSLLGYMVRGGRVEKDLISDDSALVYKSEQGLIVFIGCGHAGVENIVQRAREVCADDRVHAVIGGLHLKFSGPRRAAALGSYLQREGVGSLFACHCTGKRKVGLPGQTQIGAGFEHVFPSQKQ